MSDIGIKKLDDGSVIVENLLETLFALGKQQGATINKNLNSWAKRVTSVNVECDNGFAFEGEFVRSGTVHVKPPFPHVYLVAMTDGSRRHKVTEYLVFTFDGAEFAFTGLRTNSKQPGWALRLREDVAALLRSTKEAGKLVFPVENINLENARGIVMSALWVFDDNDEFKRAARRNIINVVEFLLQHTKRAEEEQK